MDNQNLKKKYEVTTHIKNKIKIVAFRISALKKMCLNILNLTYHH